MSLDMTEKALTKEEIYVGFVIGKEVNLIVKRTGVKLETLSIVTRIFPVRIVE